jgi:hypothetical protein
MPGGTNGYEGGYWKTIASDSPFSWASASAGTCSGVMRMRQRAGRDPSRSKFCIRQHGAAGKRQDFQAAGGTMQAVVKGRVGAAHCTSA